MFKNDEQPSLFEVHKAERRARILVSARQIIARHGVDGLTLRDLASASSVSVPTVYNLIGGKQAVLSALLGDTLARVSARLAAANGGSMVDRALALCEAGWGEILAEPGYFRELMHSFLVSQENAPIRRQIDESNVALMSGLLSAGQADGDLAAWADPVALGRALWAQYVITMLGWCASEIGDDELPATVTYGLCLLLLGVARGEATRKLERLARASQPKARLSRPAATKGAPT